MQELLEGNAYLGCGIKIFGGLVQMEVMIGFNASTGKFYRRNGFLTHKSSEPSESSFQITIKIIFSVLS